MVDRKDAAAVVKQLQADMHKQFASNTLRLGQLDSALGTAGMAVEYLYDEEEREQELRQRVTSSRSAHEKHGHQLRSPLEDS